MDEDDNETRIVSSSGSLSIYKEQQDVNLALDYP